MSKRLLLLALAVFPLAAGCVHRETYTWRPANSSGEVFVAEHHPNEGRFNYVRILLDDRSTPLTTVMTTRDGTQEHIIKPGDVYEQKGKLTIERMTFEGEGSGSMIAKY